MLGELSFLNDLVRENPRVETFGESLQSQRSAERQSSHQLDILELIFETSFRCMGECSEIRRCTLW